METKNATGNNKPATEAWLICTKEEAKPYKKYKVLFGERKFARDFPTQKQTLSFCDDLPAEIHLQVYKHLFKVPDNFFELWAPKQWAEKGSRAKNSALTYATQKRGLRMMRVCKKIGDEVREFFYGGNNFRFSYVNGFQVMAAFMHTIRSANCSFLKHITVQIPNRAYGYSQDLSSKTGWKNFEQLMARRGMRLLRYGFRARYEEQGRVLGEYNYDRAVYKCFRQLRNMPDLKLLEITFPWDYEFIKSSYCPFSDDKLTTHCPCSIEDVQAMDPKTRIWHTIEEHSSDRAYWALLADLAENSASKELTIALVIQYEMTSYDMANRISNGWPQDIVHMRQGRWLAAYASVMGYEFGHSRWERDEKQRGTYNVRYDEDPTLSVLPKSQEEDSLLEPPELPESQEEDSLPESAQLPA
ncbi:hypothetical protein N8I77_003753 [Diaporthe amygdali]|uniref:Uncharacterized protein n=1 Tax=Phomopsis amygdali TaxID=1214568 RepID=A0AAD9SJY5_PHOAM|nr:hypothetical protein N8I77_003753 [Diaporthe amygdali]